MANFWKNVGKGLAKVGRFAFSAAAWASQHPEVTAIIQGAIQSAEQAQ